MQLLITFYYIKKADSWKSLLAAIVLSFFQHLQQATQEWKFNSTPFGSVYIPVSLMKFPRFSTAPINVELPSFQFLLQFKMITVHANSPILIQLSQAFFHLNISFLILVY
jgi:hypothetical protein